jgi:hypothetical protein
VVPDRPRGLTPNRPPKDLSLRMSCRRIQRDRSRAVCACFAAGGAFLYGPSLSGAGHGGVRKRLENTHWFEEPVGRQRRESSVGSRSIVNL